MQSVRLAASERKVLIMQSGIRQSVGLTSRDTALLKGDWKLESTCEVALVVAFSHPTMSKIPSLQIFLARTYAARNPRKSAMENCEKSRFAYRITLRKVKPEKLDRSRILWPRLSPRLVSLLYSFSRGRYCNHVKLLFLCYNHIEYKIKRIITWNFFCIMSELNFV